MRRASTRLVAVTSTTATTTPNSVSSSPSTPSCKRRVSRTSTPRATPPPSATPPGLTRIRTLRFEIGRSRMGTARTLPLRRGATCAGRRTVVTTAAWAVRVVGAGWMPTRLVRYRIAWRERCRRHLLLVPSRRRRMRVSVLMLVRTSIKCLGLAMPTVRACGRWPICSGRLVSLEFWTTSRLRQR